ncbi:MAG: hypothetical protein FWC38_06175 [Proteobacteria bacterium]|nr:hypothetical protein [Pseudomonadota bacterium]
MAFVVLLFAVLLALPSFAHTAEVAHGFCDFAQNDSEQCGIGWGELANPNEWEQQA